MAEYIDREAVFHAMKMDVRPPFAVVRDFPAADVQPVVRGTWEFPIFTDSDDGLDPRVKCSVCGNIEAAFVRWKYCPNCGARMDGKEPDNEVSEP